jgi:predicted amidohydrolase
MKPLSVIPVSLELEWNDPDENLRRIEKALDAAPAAEPESRLFVFPELTLTGFVTGKPLHLTLEGPEVRRLRDIAKNHHVAIVAGFPEHNPASKEKPFNTLVLIDAKGKIVASYRKVHLFTFGKRPESDVYSAGDHPVMCELRGWKIGLATCFDLRYAAQFLAYAKEKADLIVLPACWVDGPHKTRQFEVLSAAQAVLTQAYFVSVNRSGADPEFNYDGRAYVHSPMGEQLYTGEPVELTPESLEQARKIVVRPSDRAHYRLAGKK